MKQRGLFLDRDGTLVHPRHYPARPEELQLYDDIDDGLRRLQRLGFRLVVITNQAGLALSYFGATELERMHEHLARLLAQRGVYLDGIFHCPHHPDGIVAELAIACDCRKPRPGLLYTAAAQLDLDLARSWFVGDILHDVEAGNRAGCRTALVNNGGETEWLGGPFRTPELIAADTRQALDLIYALEVGAAESIAGVTAARGEADETI